MLYDIKTGLRSDVDVCNNGHSECNNNTEKNHLYAILMLLVHLSSCYTVLVIKSEQAGQTNSALNVSIM